MYDPIGAEVKVGTMVVGLEERDAAGEDAARFEYSGPTSPAATKGLATCSSTALVMTWLNDSEANGRLWTSASTSAAAPVVSMPTYSMPEALHERAVFGCPATPIEHIETAWSGSEQGQMARVGAGA